MSHKGKNITETFLGTFHCIFFYVFVCVSPSCRHCRTVLPALCSASAILLCRSFSFVFAAACSRLNLNVYPALCGFAHFCNLLSHVSLCIFLTLLFWFFTLIFFALYFSLWHLHDQRHDEHCAAMCQEEFAILSVLLRAYKLCGSAL